LLSQLVCCLAFWLRDSILCFHYFDIRRRNNSCSSKLV
jgi:hypothetical protein